MPRVMPPPLNAEININIKVIPMLRFKVFVIAHHLFAVLMDFTSMTRI